jgi:hypothetical protein
MAPRSVVDDRHHELDELRARILRRIESVLQAAGVDAHEVTCTVDGGLDRLEVVLAGPGRLRSVQQALGVRVVDAVRSGARTVGSVAVAYRFGAEG